MEVLSLRSLAMLDIINVRLNIQNFLRYAHTMCLCVLRGSENKQRLFHCTALTDWLYRQLKVRIQGCCTCTREEEITLSTKIHSKLLVTFTTLFHTISVNRNRTMKLTQYFCLICIMMASFQAETRSINFDVIYFVCRHLLLPPSSP